LVLPAAVLIFLLGFGVWLLLRNRGPAAGPAPEPPRPTETSERHRLRALAPTVVPPAPPTGPDARPFEYADDGVPFMPPGPNDPRPDRPVHPHPITPQHLRIFRENELLGQLDGAMDVKDAAALRKLLRTYRAEYPEDPQQMQGGYELIANCLDHPGDAATRAAAQKYFDEERASTLRRFVLRHCLERQP
jgi:hypothetical protein